MKLLDNQLDDLSLSKFGEEACRLFIAKDFQKLATTFGYAMAYNQDIATAIQADFERCLSGRCLTHGERHTTIESVKVKGFPPNDIELISAIACVLLLDDHTRIQIDLAVAKNGENKNLYLEDINALS